jgi:hypothetical protein
MCKNEERKTIVNSTTSYSCRIATLHKMVFLLQFLRLCFASKGRTCDCLKRVEKGLQKSTLSLVFYYCRVPSMQKKEGNVRF